ncbi:MAG: winged helix-turn-helix transcriptional regulator [Paracoccaceae bacterium]
MAIIASKWKPMILFNLWLGELRFSDIKRTCTLNRTVYYLLSNDRYTKEYPTAVNLRI